MREHDNLAEMLRMIRNIDERCAETHKDMTGMEGKLDLLISAFPDNGFAAHRSHHIDIEDAKKDAKTLRGDIKRSLLTWGVPAVLGIILLALWEYFKHQVRQ